MLERWKAVLCCLIVYLQTDGQSAIVCIDQLVIVGDYFSEADDLAALNDQRRS
ncbi:hypothetical protein X738_26800 [Mesorhizobium sp. LNHC209A00]|nr:hypothetical protein X738_26800 [Mesorhizobium sp. LNHC209A00]